MYPVTNDEGLYVMPYPEFQWTELQCPCDGLGATSASASLPPAWKWAVALSLTGATIWLALRWAGKEERA
jgi:hypothetical protein